ncbi:MAG: hypothetical protein R2883_00580 [Caldisericia bacterium]
MEKQSKTVFIISSILVFLVIAGYIDFYYYGKIQRKRSLYVSGSSVHDASTPRILLDENDKAHLIWSSYDPSLIFYIKQGDDGAGNIKGEKFDGENAVVARSYHYWNYFWKGFQLDKWISPHHVER